MLGATTNRRKRVPRAGIRVFTVKSPIKAWANSCKMCTEDLVQTHLGPVLAALVSRSACEPCLLDSEAHVLLVVSTPLTPTIFPPPLLQDSLSSDGKDLMETSHLDSLSAWTLAVVLCIYSHLLLEEASLVMTEYSRTSLGVFLLISLVLNSSAWFYSRPLNCLVFGSWLHQQCQVLSF